MDDIFVLFFASIIITIIITTIVFYALKRSIVFIAYFSDGNTARQGSSYSVTDRRGT